MAYFAKFTERGQRALLAAQKEAAQLGRTYVGTEHLLLGVLTEPGGASGVLGGITTGMPVVVRAAFKPTPSIAAEQDSVSLSAGRGVRLSVPGRHDPCIVPRAVPCVEAAVAVTLYDLLLERS